jgi:hypothetical protein
MSCGRTATITAVAVGLDAALARGWASRFAPTVSFADHFPFLFQLLSPTWNPTGQATGWMNAVPLQIGLAPLGLGLLALALSFRPAPAKLPTGERLSDDANGLPASSTSARLDYWSVVALVGGLLMLAPLLPVWRATGFDAWVTYPWQMMGLLGLALSVLGGAVVALDDRLREALVQAGLITFVVLASYSYLTPRYYDFEVNFTPTAKVAHAYTMEPRPAPVAVLGDHQIALLDYRLEGPLLHGATVRLNVLWQALRPLDRDYLVFVHVVDDRGRIWSQRDTEPHDGEYPTSRWGEGEVVADRYEFQIPLDGPREGYCLEVGLYRKDSGERLAVGGDTRVVLRSE